MPKPSMPFRKLHWAKRNCWNWQAFDMAEQILIDGSEGEGGGQMVRSSMSLAAITGTPVQVVNIRAGRSKPGLGRQHLTSVRAAAQICNGALQGDELRSQSVLFVPEGVQPGRYDFQVGTAGSAMLVLQTVLPPLLTASGPSTVILEGGTHNQWAPPFDFVHRSYLSLLNQMGPTVTARLERHGFFPAGGGRVVVEVQPSETLAGFDLLERGKLCRRQLKALVSNLPENIAEREVRLGQRKLNWRQEETEIETVSSNGPGNVVFAEIEYENVTSIFTGFGQKGVTAEQVVGRVVRDVRTWLKHEAPVGEYLADQILLPLGLSAAQDAEGRVARGGTFRTVGLSQHSLTHIDILQKFLDIDVSVTEDAAGTQVVVGPC